MESEYNKDLEKLFADKRRAAANLSPENEDRVLGLIIALGASFPSEIARHLLLSVEEVNIILIRIINEEKAEKLLPDPIYPQPLIKCRMYEMKSLGVDNYEKFAFRSWFIATEKGYWYYADKFKGEHKRASVAYLETYPNVQLINRMGVKHA